MGLAFILRTDDTDIRQKEKEIKKQVDSNFDSNSRTICGFFLAQPCEKQCFYTSKALLFACKLNAFRTQYQCYYNPLLLN